MAAYRRVYDSRHLQADCQEPGSAPQPNARQSSRGDLFARCMDDQMLKFGGGRVSLGGFAAETENSANADIRRRQGRLSHRPHRCWCAADGGVEEAMSDESGRVASDHVNDSDAAEFRPRLCELKTSPDFAGGYGFDLHVNDRSHVNYIGAIDPGSPAEAAGK